MSAIKVGCCIWCDNLIALDEIKEGELIYLPYSMGEAYYPPTELHTNCEMKPKDETRKISL